MWIVGGREALLALLALAGWSEARAFCEHHMSHAAWHGFRAWDLVFPLFLFLAGVSTSYSFSARRARGADRSELAWYAVRRAALLVLAGAVYNGLLSFDFAHQRWASVLGRIGLAWLGAALVALWLATRGRLIVCGAILTAYWIALVWFDQSRGFDGFLPQGQNLADWFDQRFLPGRLHAGDHDPEGLLSTIPAIATALLGTLTGDWLRRTDLGSSARLRGLGLAASALLALGYGWSTVLPLNKHLWTSSFVLVCAGFSVALVALFHIVFDLVGSPRAARVLGLLGAHALVAYMAARFVDLEGLVRVVMGRALERQYVHEALVPLASLALLWWSLAAFAALRSRKRADTNHSQRVCAGRC